MLVIISLIVGGVIGGQSLIHSARLNQVMAEVTGFKTAVNTFTLQYDALPGDMRDAYDYWGVAEGCADNTGATGCNGNGDGQIYGFPGREQLRAWQHLSLADLLKSKYTGALDGGSDYTIGVNIARSAISDSAAYMIRYNATDTYGRSENNIMFGSKSAAAFLWGASLNSIDARRIDSKLDDGVAYTGDIIAVDAYDGSSTLTGCVDNGTTAPSNYVLTNKDVKCRLHFFLE